MPASIERKRKKVAPIVVAGLVVLYVAPLIIMTILGMAGMFELGVGLAPVLVVLLYLLIGGAIIGGVLLALRQRLREIDGGEEEDARIY